MPGSHENDREKSPVRANPVTSSRGHDSVMVKEVLSILAPADGEVFVDATFGAGGYSEAILNAADCRVWGIDRDPEAIARGRDMALRYQNRLHPVSGCFAQMDALLRAEGVTEVHGVTLDIGVSSLQLDDPERGFSFRFDGPLDMRMSRHGPSAADIVNSADEKTLADIIFHYGEEHGAKRIARAIVRSRMEKPITRTGDLAALVGPALGARGGRRKIHPATKTFQALRIFVNDELDQLRRGLIAAERILAPEGRLCVVSFHSLEDRIVKEFLAARSGQRSMPSRHLPVPAPRTDRFEPTFRLNFRGVKKPTAAECHRNRRARSARLRGATRTSAPAWPEETVA